MRSKLWVALLTVLVILLTVTPTVLAGNGATKDIAVPQWVNDACVQMKTTGDAAKEAVRAKFEEARLAAMPVIDQAKADMAGVTDYTVGQTIVDQARAGVDAILDTAQVDSLAIAKPANDAVKDVFFAGMIQAQDILNSIVKGYASMLLAVSAGNALTSVGFEGSGARKALGVAMDELDAMLVPLMPPPVVDPVPVIL